MSATDDLKTKTVGDLRALARARGLRGYSGLRKQELIRLLAKSPPAAARASSPPEPAARTRPRPAVPMDIEQRVEDAKFALVPPMLEIKQSGGGAEFSESIERQPVPGEPRLALLPQKPGILHVYWTLPAAPTEPLRLRLYRVRQTGDELLAEISIGDTTGHHYFHVPETAEPLDCYVDLVRAMPDGRCENALPRATAIIPGNRPSGRVDPQWWISDKEFGQFSRSGGSTQTAHPIAATERPSSPGPGRNRS